MWKIGIIALLLLAIAVPSALFATQGQSGQEARVAAYKHEDGRVEFAIQVRDGNTWGERLLPRGRTLGANARTGRWLTSTPVALPASSTATGEFVPVVVWTGTEYHDLDHGEVGYLTDWDWDTATLITDIAVRSVYDHKQNQRIERAVLRLRCEQGTDEHGDTFKPARFSAGVYFYVHGPYGRAELLTDYVTRGDRRDADGVIRHNQPAVAFWGYRTDRFWSDEGYWSDYDVEWWSRSLEFPREFMHELRQYSSLVVGVAVEERGERQTFIARFDDLQDFFGTELQENINRCGEYPLNENYTGPRRPEDGPGEGH